MKILPIAYSPVNAYLNEPHTCNIILNDDKGYEWIYNCFVQWEWSTDALVTYMPEHIYGNISVAQICAIPNAVFPRSGKAFLDLIIRALDHDYYVATCLNELRISTAYYQRDRHNVLIYGYDEAKEEVYIMTYKRGWGVYGQCKCTFSEIADSYENLGEYAFNDPNDTDNINFVRRRSMERCCFNIGLVKGLLEDYLMSKDSRWRFDPLAERRNCSLPNCGVNCYDRFLEYINNRKNSPSIDIRSFCAFFEHKNIMFERIKYLEKEGWVDCDLGISSQYEIICRMAEKIKLLAMKFLVVKRGQILDTICEEIKKIQKDEPQIIEKIVGELEKVCG